MILKKNKSGKILLKKKRCYAARRNDMGIISTPILLYCNLMLKCKRKNLLKFLFIIGTNWLLYRLIYKKVEDSNNLAQRLKRNQIMELFFLIHWL